MENFIELLKEDQQHSESKSCEDEELQFSLNLIEIAVSKKKAALKKEETEIKSIYAKKQSTLSDLSTQCEEVEKSLEKVTRENTELELENQKLEAEITRLRLAQTSLNKGEQPSESSGKKQDIKQPDMMFRNFHHARTVSQGNFLEKTSKEKTGNVLQQIKKKLSPKEFSTFLILIKKTQKECMNEETLQQIEFLFGEENSELFESLRKFFY